MMIGAWMHLHQWKRRKVITLLGGAAAWPIAAGAQGERVRRIGVLVSGTETDREMQARLGGLQQGLARLGWAEGRNISIEYRYAAADAEQMHAAARELVALHPDVLIGLATQPSVALRQQTKTIPIVFTGAIDPIGAGLIVSIARPGGNATGLLLYEDSIAGKWLGMLKEIAPQTKRVATFLNPRTSPSVYLQAATAIAPSLAIEVVPIVIETAADIERGMEAFGQTAGDALLVGPDLTAAMHRNLIIALAARLRLPAIYQARFWVEDGGLMSYGTDRVAANRQTAYYIDRILRSEQPANLPVQGPTKFETFVNLKTAKALGISVPPRLLLAADEVIE
jgi:putative tryptophan/tyrosine transport system substrate-binding protein